MLERLYKKDTYHQRINPSEYKPEDIILFTKLNYRIEKGRIEKGLNEGVLRIKWKDNETSLIIYFFDEEINLVMRKIT